MLRTALLISCCAVSGSALAATNPIPFLHDPLAPSSVLPGSDQLELTISGTGFVSGSVVHWNGSPRATTVQSKRRITATIPASDLAVATSAFVTVVNPAPGGGTSNVAHFQVVSPRDTLSFKRQAQYTSGEGSFSEPFNVITSDFNGDGRLDLASANVNDSTLSVFLGKGDGTFNSQVVYAANLAIDLAAGDFNGDGAQDLAVLDFGAVNGGPGNVLLMLGNGDGTFLPPIAAPAGKGPYSITVADFNRDGKLDAAVADYATGGDSVSVLLGNGDGTFRPLVSYPTAEFPSHVTTGDVDGDGRLDLVVAVRDATNHGISVFLGKGDGTFRPRTDIPFGLSPIWAALSDLNGDGALDVAAANGDEYVAVLLGNGDGTFGSPTNYFTKLYSQTVAVGIADLDGDNVQDLAVNTGVGTAVLLAAPAGIFERDKQLKSENAQGIAVGDFNRDGRPDLSVVGWGSQSVFVWVQAP